MKHLFVSYDIALKLKEKGFDEPCFGYYRPMKPWMMEGTRFNPEPHFHGCNWPNEDNSFYFMYVQNSFGDRNSVVKNSEFTKATTNVAVPLYQQVIDWLREKHSIVVFVNRDIFDGQVIGWEGVVERNLERQLTTDAYSEYYEALDVAIRHALELI